MSASTHLSTWVSKDMKQRFSAVARRHDLSDSALLKRIVEQALLTAPAAEVSLREHEPVARASRLSVRLTQEDQLVLRERAAARAMPAATYVSVLVRSHLRRLTPIPKTELLLLKQSTAELSAVGRNLNQLARAANEGARVVGPTRDDLRAMIKLCEGLRDHIRALIKANAQSWESGHAEPSD